MKQLGHLLSGDTWPIMIHVLLGTDNSCCRVLNATSCCAGKESPRSASPAITCCLRCLCPGDMPTTAVNKHRRPQRCITQAVLPALQPNLSAPSQRLRAATLALLCCYDPPFALLPAPAQVTPRHAVDALFSCSSVGSCISLKITCMPVVTLSGTGILSRHGNLI